MCPASIPSVLILCWVTSSSCVGGWGPSGGLMVSRLRLGTAFAVCCRCRGDRGWPVHEDVASTFWTNGAADWVQLFALGLITWWLVGYFVTLYVAIRLWDANPQASKDAIAQGTLRHAVGIALVVLAYFSGWGSPRRGGWFYGPYCPYGEEQDADRLTFSYWCFLSCAVLHVTICTVVAMFHSVVVRRALYPDHIIVVSRSQVPTFLQAVLDACPQCISLHGEEPNVGFMWENGRTDDLRLKTWKQDLCKRRHNCVTIEIHIRPADSFSAGTIQSLGYTFYAKLKDLKPLKEGSVQVYQAVIRSRRCAVATGLFFERFFSNLLLLGFLHEIHFQHFGVNSACIRLEKRVRMLPQHELEKLCHDCYTLSASHLSRVPLQGAAAGCCFKVMLQGFRCSVFLQGAAVRVASECAVQLPCWCRCRVPLQGAAVGCCFRVPLSDCRCFDRRSYTGE
eukprot:s1782_g7.t1